MLKTFPKSLRKTTPLLISIRYLVSIFVRILNTNSVYPNKKYIFNINQILFLCRKSFFKYLRLPTLLPLWMNTSTHFSKYLSFCFLQGKFSINLSGTGVRVSPFSGWVGVGNRPSIWLQRVQVSPSLTCIFTEGP